MDPIAAAWRAGTVLWIGRAAGVQFGGDRAITLRLVSVDEQPTYEGAAWVTGYVLNARGEAITRRELYIDVTAGVRVLPPHAPAPARRPAAASSRQGRPTVPPARGTTTKPPHRRGGPGRGDRSAGRGLDQTREV